MLGNWVFLHVSTFHNSKQSVFWLLKSMQIVGDRSKAQTIIYHLGVPISISTIAFQDVIDFEDIELFPTDLSSSFRRKKFQVAPKKWFQIIEECLSSGDDCISTNELTTNSKCLVRFFFPWAFVNNAIFWTCHFITLVHAWE